MESVIGRVAPAPVQSHHHFPFDAIDFDQFVQDRALRGDFAQAKQHRHARHKHRDPQPEQSCPVIREKPDFPHWPGHGRIFRAARMPPAVSIRIQANSMAMGEPARARRSPAAVGWKENSSSTLQLSADMRARCSDSKSMLRLMSSL